MKNGPRDAPANRSQRGRFWKVEGMMRLAASNGYERHMRKRKTKVEIFCFYCGRYGYNIQLPLDMGILDDLA